MADKKQGANGSVFVSYSRKDKKFIKKLNDALDAAGVQAWVDWEGIELASDWRAEIYGAIQDSDAFLFVITPDSLKSKVCAEELELGLKYNKKLIPILHRPAEKGTKIPKPISKTNWVYLRKEDNFKETLPKLVEAINTDLGWVQQHTKLLGQAVEWETKNKNNSFLLNGTELKEAEGWIANASVDANRNVLPVQAEFISTSRRSADRRQRVTLFGISFALVLSIVLSVFAFIARNDAQISQQAAQTNEAIAIQKQKEAAEAQATAEVNEAEAKRQTRLAEAERSAAQSQIYQSRPGELDTSTLLAIDSWQRVQSFQAEDLIRSNISLFPMPVAQMKQDGSIFNIEWSPDFQYFVTGNRSDESNPQAKNEACVWNGSTGEKQFCVEHDDDVTDALFSPDGQYLITASADKSVRFWNPSNGDLIQRFNYEGAVLDLDASTRVLAIGREDNYLTLYYFNRPDLKPIDYEYVLKVANVKQNVGIGSVRFTPDGNFLAFGTTQGSVEFWQASQNFFYHGPKHPNSTYVVLAFSPDNTWLVSGGGDSLSRLTKRDGTGQYSIPHGDWVEDVAFGPDPSWYVTVSDDNRVRVIETATGEEKIRMSHSDFVQKVKVSPDGRWIASTGYDKVVRIWDSISGGLVLEFPLEENGSAVSFNADGSRIVAADESGSIFIWDISYLAARLNYIVFPEFVHEARFAPSGDTLVVNADDYNVWKYPAAGLTSIQDGTAGETLLTAPSLTYNTAISPDSNWVAVVEKDAVNPQRNRASLVSMVGQVIVPLDHGGEVTSVGFSHDNQFALTAGVNGLLTFWTTGTSEKQFDLDNLEPILSMAASPSTSIVAVGLHDATRIWDFNTKSILANLPQGGDIIAIAFSDDGQWLATGSSGGTVKLWRAGDLSFTRTGADMRVGGQINMLSFSPDGKTLSGGGLTGFAYLWDVSTTQETTRIRHSDAVTSVAFSPDGGQLITVARKLVQVWDLSALEPVTTDQLIAFACRRLTSNLSKNSWETFFGIEEYHLICEGLPEGR